MAKAIAKKGPPRKSRRKRLPHSSASGRPEFAPSEEDWKRIEAAYPLLTVADRETITAIVNEYLHNERFERNAPFLDDALKWLKAAEKSATRFWKTTWGGGDSEKGDAIFYAQDYVERHIDDHGLQIPGESKWDALVSIMTNVVAALAIARREVPKEARAGFVEGETWDAMICQLSDFAEAKGFPVGASKGVDKAASSKPSPFVAFIREIQNTFPAVSRRHNASDIAIAEAISVARRKRRARRKAKSPDAAS
jgi:hypothetical protein